jgi:hypothetical protein
MEPLENAMMLGAFGIPGQIRKGWHISNRKDV